MTIESTSDLKEGERRLILSEIHEALRQSCPHLLERSGCLPQPSLAEVDKHLDELVLIVRRSTATRVEPYLAQILDDICPHCPQQQPIGYCPLRHQGDCILYRCAGAIVAAVRRALREIEIERGLMGSMG